MRWSVGKVADQVVKGWVGDESVGFAIHKEEIIIQPEEEYFPMDMDPLVPSETDFGKRHKSKTTSEKNQQPKHACMYCGRSYFQQQSLNRHLAYQCSVQPRFSCFYCPYRSKLRETMKSHMKSAHKDVEGKYFFDGKMESFKDDLRP
ncbi:hypothetical protein QAD02_022617 [Eretmocerus hayati]|uniref:Uncharacterized protein n=1 Tax=Eretmocerus hayati TaxID=131215 RepID=A0ACC2PUM6_9HYME|nr:hypothetical protein QAD02_022617 [Eretmocerus hayati]